MSQFDENKNHSSFVLRAMATLQTGQFWSCAFAIEVAQYCKYRRVFGWSYVVQTHAGEDVAAGALDMLAIELIGERFLRKMVRVLVATAIREASIGSATGGQNDALIKLSKGRNRLSTAPAAPAEGLCFSGVGYDPYDH